MKKEIEVKIKINDTEKIIKKIEDLGGVSLPDIDQRMWGFFTPNYSNLKTGIFPRIRLDNETATLTIKVKKESSNSYFKREEYTLGIDSVETGTEILRILGYTKIKLIKKLRKTWELNKVMLCLDKVYFGTYLEIEGCEKEIEEAIKALGLQKEERITKSYLYLEELANKRES